MSGPKAAPDVPPRSRLARRGRGRCVALILSLAVPGCGCPAGLSPSVLAHAYFGLGRDNGQPPVPDAAWDAFLHESVTPSFPEGYTVLGATGQWRDGQGRSQREQTRMVLAVLPRTTAEIAAGRLASLATIWRERHGQESVLVTTASGCAVF